MAQLRPVVFVGAWTVGVFILLFSCHTAAPFVNRSLRSSSWGSSLRSSLCNIPALQHLNLTADDIIVIETRLNGITPRQRHDRHIDDGEDHENLVVSFARRSQTMKRNLAYLEDRLELNVEELRRIVVGYPRILSLSLENDLIHTIDFFDDALSLKTNDSVRSLLCDMPSLMEYNVAKRLKPRLKRVRCSLLGRDACVDTEMLRLIATLTNSRFESWLQSLHSNQDEEDTNGNSNVYDKQYQSTYKQSNTPALYVIVSNLQSGNNIGNILRSASIFGCEEFIVVGQRRYRLTGEHGSRFDLQRRHLWSHIEAKEYLHAKGVRIYGIEIMENAIPVMRYDLETGVVHFPFNREYSGAAFIYGNEGSGLSTKQKDICDEFVYVPQHRGGTKDVVGGEGGSASLNVASAATVVMQAYCLWAGYSDARREGEKFVRSETTE